MANNIGDIISKKQFSEPEEFKIIRRFVLDRFDEKVDLKIQNKMIVISVKGSALAGELQLCLHELSSSLPASTKLRIQIA